MSEACRCINCKHGVFLLLGPLSKPESRVPKYVGKCAAKGMRTTQNARCPLYDEKE